MNALEHFEDLYGHMGLSPSDAAQWVFLSGWNAAIEELIGQINKMPIEKDTQASFVVYLQGIMHTIPDKID